MKQLSRHLLFVITALLLASSVQAGPVYNISELSANKSNFVLTAATRPSAGISEAGSACMSTCLYFCPKDSIGGIEVACMFSCLKRCAAVEKKTAPGVFKLK
ncbi:MAG: hypothetical protein R3F02_05550 [Thiolinea sp.]